MSNTSKYKDIFRVPSNRLRVWDYSSNGYYFITICVKDRKCVLGEIKDKKMFLSDIGNIIKEEWFQTSKIRSNVSLDEFVIMPNHIHGILIINSNVETSRRDVSTNKKLQPNSLGSIVGQFKSIATKRIRNIYPEFSWQPRYYDHIIRNEISLQSIREYIRWNPFKWEIDEENPSKS
ncbi:transposase [soil metagenome]